MTDKLALNVALVLPAIPDEPEACVPSELLAVVNGLRSGTVNGPD